MPLVRVSLAPAFLARRFRAPRPERGCLDRFCAGEVPLLLTVCWSGGAPPAGAPLLRSAEGLTSPAARHFPPRGAGVGFGRCPTSLVISRRPRGRTKGSVGTDLEHRSGDAHANGLDDRRSLHLGRGGTGESRPG